MDKTYKKDNTNTYISLGFLAVFSLMGIAMGLSMATLNSANNEISSLIEDTGKKTSLAYQMRDVIRLRSSAIKSFVQVNDPEQREKILSKLVSSTDSYHKSRHALESLGANPREQEVLDKVNEAEARVTEAYDKASNTIYSMSSTPEMLRSVLSEVQLQELVLLNQLNDLVKLEKTLADETLNANNSRYNRIERLLVLLLLAAFLVCLMIARFIIQRVTDANQKIAHLATHDDLTGLNNRRSFEQHLEHTIQRTSHSKLAFGLMFIDLDRFKIVNDTCGHHAGDQLLIQLTTMIKARLNKSDMFARIGGDEFAVIASARTFDDVADLAEDLRLIVNDFEFIYAGKSFNVTLSIGIIPIDGEITDLEEVLQNVDSACYVAKQSGRNTVHITQENDTEVVKYRSDIAGMQNIRAALAQDRLVLFYQPVFRILSEGISMEHCEILLRIKSESGELFSPAEFIPIAEKYNVMTEIDRWVISHVLDWVVAHQDAYETPKLLINLSGLSFINGKFLEFVLSQLRTRDIDPTKLAFEITETAAVDNMEKANVFIERIRDIGCSFALDDFGSGFSTFSYLKELPIDYLKIDGSLVRNIAIDSIDREMVRAINQIGHTVGASTIAEFVEDDQALERLREMGVDYAQGYGLCKPKALVELSQDLPARKPGELRKAS